MKRHNPTILLVDDDDDDRSLLGEVINKIDPSFFIMEAHNGEEAMGKLKELKEANNLPYLIVMDINMPKMDGKQALVAIKEDLDTTHIPIVIFTTSNSEVDKLFFQNKRTEMITKPVEFQELYNVAAKMLNYCKT